MDWTRYRTVGIDLALVGILVLLVAIGFTVDWTTLVPGGALLVAGVVFILLSRRRGEGTP